MVFVFARFLLMPFALIAAVFLAMTLHIVGTALYHQAAWNRTVATVTDVSPYTEMHKNGFAIDRINVALAYTIDDTPMTWSGNGKVVGLYKASIGDEVEFYYDPSDPSNLDAAGMRGWRGMLLLIAGTGGFTVFYVWFFWLRRMRR